MKTAKKKRRPSKLTHEQLNAMPLHKLLAIGLRDLRKHEKARDCIVDMGDWLRSNGKCRACLAGSVLRHEFGCRNLRDAMQFNTNWMEALDQLRRGDVCEALFRIGRMETVATAGLNRTIQHYLIDREQFYRDMCKLHRDLKEAGL